MAEMNEAPVIDPAKIQMFGQRLFGMYETYQTDRLPAEQRWLKNLFQYRGIYDADIAKMIPADRSKAYPKLTRWKIIGTVARLMQMLFPQTEKNYSIKPSPLPDLSVVQLQEVLDALVALTAQEQQIPPEQVELKDEDIERAISDYAAHKALRMELKVDDDLQEMDYITLARKVVFSAALYNIGVLEGPLNRKVKARVWERNPYTGKYTAKEIDKFKPLFEFLRVWDWYPDMTAKSINEQDGSFKRHIMTREQVEKLAERPDFMAPQIREWLRTHSGGNFIAKWWESSIKGEPKSDRGTANPEPRKYEIASWYGNVSGHELRAAGIEVGDDMLSRSVLADVWIIGNTVIKAKLAPLPDAKRYHTFIFEDDDLSLLGNGLCDVLRDSQLSICETARAALDNMSVIGPAVELNTDMLTPGQNLSIAKHKTWFREGEGAQASYPAVRDISIQSHLTELTALLQMFIEFANNESGLPPPSLGDTSGGGSEALRTSKNASMFLGAAALPIRDTVRNFDIFTVSVISGDVAWNRKYDPNPSRDGDFNVIARGSTSLIAKEVLAQNLNEFRAGITEDELPYVDTRKMLMVRARANDIPTDEILKDEAVAERDIQAMKDGAAEQQKANMELIKSQIGEAMTSALKNAANAKKLDAGIEQDAEKLKQAAAQLVLDAMDKGHKNAIAEHEATKPEPAKAAA